MGFKKCPNYFLGKDANNNRNNRLEVLDAIILWYVSQLNQSGGGTAAGGYNGGGTGRNSTAPSWISGGGGGGYYGGGSAGNHATHGNGGGGSGYAPTGTNTQGSGGNVANSVDADYPGSVGNSTGAVTGQNGYAVIIETPQAMTLIADTVTALSVPTTAHITLFKEDIDSITVNTDLLAWTSRSKQTFTSDYATDDKLDATAHGLENDARVILTSSGADLPAGLDSGTVYYVVNKTTNDFEVSLTSAGAAVQLTDDGTGTHSVQAVTQVTLVDEGTYSSYDILAGSADISGQPSDTDMGLFVQSANDKAFKVHGQALHWS